VARTLPAPNASHPSALDAIGYANIVVTDTFPVHFDSPTGDHTGATTKGKTSCTPLPANHASGATHWRNAMLADRSKTLGVAFAPLWATLAGQPKAHLAMTSKLTRGIPAGAVEWDAPKLDCMHWCGNDSVWAEALLGAVQALVALGD